MMEQLRSELSFAHNQMETAAAEIEQAQADRAAAQSHTWSLAPRIAVLSAEVGLARAEQVAAIKSLVESKGQQVALLNEAWGDRHSFETDLRREWANEKAEYRRANTARERELPEAGMQAAVSKNKGRCRPAKWKT